MSIHVESIGIGGGERGRRDARSRCSRRTAPKRTPASGRRDGGRSRDGVDAGGPGGPRRGRVPPGGPARSCFGGMSAPAERLNDLDGPVWVAHSVTVFESRPGSRSALKKEHPATFPEEDAARLIRFFTRRGGLVLDPFAGAGSTLIAAAREGRRPQVPSFTRSGAPPPRSGNRPGLDGRWAARARLQGPSAGRAEQVPPDGGRAACSEPRHSAGGEALRTRQ